MKATVLLAVAVMSVTGGLAGAAMWWDRTDPGATWQEWGFSDGSNPATPELVVNPGTPTAEISATGVSHGYDPGWYDTFLGREGVWHGSLTTVTLHIPNFVTQNTFKEVWVEVGFGGYLLPNPDRPEFGDEYAPQIMASIGGNPASTEMIGQPIIEATGDGWQKLTIGWRIAPNPDEEDIFLAFSDSGADLDYIIVDTICAPEPATMGMLGIGSLLLLYRKR